MGGEYQTRGFQVCKWEWLTGPKQELEATQMVKASSFTELILKLSNGGSPSLWAFISSLQYNSELPSSTNKTPLFFFLGLICCSLVFLFDKWLFTHLIRPDKNWPDPNPPKNSGFWTWFSRPEPEINRTRKTCKFLGQTRPESEPAHLTRILCPYF